MEPPNIEMLSALPELTNVAGLDWSRLPTINDVEACIPTDISQFLLEDNTVTSGAVYNARVLFGAKQLKSLPNIFFQRGANCFLHRHLYEEHSPVIIQDAFSASALYAGRNMSNESLVWADINRKTRDLVQNSEPTFSTSRHLLASVQAMLIYQMIRLFDGNIRQRVDAEADEIVLLGWTEQLMARLQPLNSPSSGSLSSEISFPAGITNSTQWHDWIFHESMRRTVLVVYMLQGIYQFLKFGSDNVSGKVDRLSFTGQSALWNASSQYQWQLACKENSHFEVLVANWDVDMADAKPEDLDELGILMMATYKGLDITSEWLGKDNLQQYGLQWSSAGTNDT